MSKPEEPLVISAGPLTRVFTGVASRYAIRGLPRYAKNRRVFTPRLRGFAGYHGVGVATTLQLQRSFLLFFLPIFFLSLVGVIWCSNRVESDARREVLVARRNNNELSTTMDSRTCTYVSSNPRFFQFSRYER